MVYFSILTVTDYRIVFIWNSLHTKGSEKYYSRTTMPHCSITIIIGTYDDKLKFTQIAHFQDWKLQNMWVNKIKITQKDKSYIHNIVGVTVCPIIVKNWDIYMDLKKVNCTLKLYQTPP
jgi:hypothetical protein